MDLNGNFSWEQNDWFLIKLRIQGHPVFKQIHLGPEKCTLVIWHLNGYDKLLPKLSGLGAHYYL